MVIFQSNGKGEIKLNFYIGDLHFGHKNVLEFDHRPYLDVEDMDRNLIKCWNDKVSDDDNVYILGDFAFCNKKPEEWYLEQLKGKKHLVIGNHDNKLLRNQKAVGYFESVEKMMHVVDNGQHICLCHFPIASWYGRYKGHWHIYAHVHCDVDDAFLYMMKFEKALNATACINYYTPSSLSELVSHKEEILKKYMRKNSC